MKVFQKSMPFNAQRRCILVAGISLAILCVCYHTCTTANGRLHRRLPDRQSNASQSSRRTSARSTRRSTVESYSESSRPCYWDTMKRMKGIVSGSSVRSQSEYFLDFNNAPTPPASSYSGSQSSFSQSTRCRSASRSSWHSNRSSLHSAAKSVATNPRRTGSKKSPRQSRSRSRSSSKKSDKPISKIPKAEPEYVRRFIGYKDMIKNAADFWRSCNPIPTPDEKEKLIERYENVAKEVLKECNEKISQVNNSRSIQEPEKKVLLEERKKARDFAASRIESIIPSLRKDLEKLPDISKSIEKLEKKLKKGGYGLNSKQMRKVFKVEFQTKKEVDL